MLEFSDAPYHFFPPKPSRPLIWLGRKLNQHLILPGSNHKIAELLVEGASESIKEERSRGVRHLFVFNHPTHSDPQSVTEMQRRLPVPSSFMAAYDVFLRSKKHTFLMQKLGHFSIDREGSDRKAMSTAIDILKAGDFALNIFPEGNVYLTNDRVTPFLDGTAFIAIKAHQALKDEGEVRIVPVSLKYTHLTNVRPVLLERRDLIAADTGFKIKNDVSDVQSVIDLGMHLLAIYLKEHGISNENHTHDEAGFRESLNEVTLTLITDLENKLELAPSEGQDLIARIRSIRSRIHQIRIDTETGNSLSEEMRKLADKAILAFRILSYLDPYLTEKPNLDRLCETAERLGEDFYSKILTVHGPRRSIMRIHPSISVAECLESVGGKARDAVGALTPQMEKIVQGGIDDMNEANDAPGAKMLEV